MKTQKVIINKQVTIDLLCLIANPEELLKDKVDWSKVLGDKKTIGALWEFHLSGCNVFLKTKYPENEISPFLDKYSLWETGLKIVK